MTAVTAVSNALVTIAGPEITTTGQAVMESDTVTQDMKRGLYGMVEDGVYAMYDSQPYINVYAHLAQEWVPGYDDSAAVYAEIDTGPYDSGYKELVNSGIVGLWTQVRNLTYVFFIIIFIVVGFMIMFRSKIGGQTLVTLGNTLPNIILALIGVTFSFAIAGLIIDIGGVIMVILTDIFEAEGVSKFDQLVTLESYGGIYRTFGSFFEWDNLKESGLLSFGGVGLGKRLLLSIPVVSGGIGILGLIVMLLFACIAVFGTFKVFLSLIKSYLGILVGVVTGPIQIAISALPGKGEGFVNWMLSILRNVLVYPVTFAILNFPGVLYSLDGEGGLSLPGPDKLTLPQSDAAVNQSGDFISGFLVLIVEILVLFVASNADKYVQAIIPPKTSKEGGAAAEAALKSLQGIPLVGSLIK